ncbi:unnamed protein product [Vitrella brassicaformis CCMP3155]|uniref:Uncharacterized protein n=1 Tax=Vitrella brassicaformis (strain CCMP3155) TaxID=1169540 RepID=A0A0G4F552_VITBC|nr:unnamed protein product [Vitrella brassicaformis CCMP3155]|eukprot:CEM06962.1 unnamed protein product [Vitrella brassicaformis CCMP3155]
MAFHHQFGPKREPQAFGHYPHYLPQTSFVYTPSNMIPLNTTVPQPPRPAELLTPLGGASTSQMDRRAYSSVMLGPSAPPTPVGSHHGMVMKEPLIVAPPPRPQGLLLPPREVTWYGTMGPVSPAVPAPPNSPNVWQRQPYMPGSVPYSPLHPHVPPAPPTSPVQPLPVHHPTYTRSLTRPEADQALLHEIAKLRSENAQLRSMVTMNLERTVPNQTASFGGQLDADRVVASGAADRLGRVGDDDELNAAGGDGDDEGDDEDDDDDEHEVEHVVVEGRVVAKPKKRAKGKGGKGKAKGKAKK